MKGLLLKDFYLAWRYCRILLILVVVFIALSWAGEGSMFFLFYPIILVSMIPVTLLGYDERDRWMGYSAALPYTRGQLVSAKYLVGLCFSGGAKTTGSLTPTPTPLFSFFPRCFSATAPS